VSPAWAALAIDAALLTFAGGDTRIDSRLPDLPNTRVPAARAGQVVSTGTENAELLFGAANFVRLAPESHIDLRAMRLAGTAMVDLASGPAVELRCGDALVRLMRGGVYRLDCGTSPAAAVRKGAALVAAAGKRVRVNAGYSLALRPGSAPAPTVAAANQFELWCGERRRRAEGLRRSGRPLSTSTDVVLRGAEEIDRYRKIPRP
jgi:hypothetical protein